MKTYVIILSKFFPKTHKRAGQPTNFNSSFSAGQLCTKCEKSKIEMCMGECFANVKLHTIRGNYQLWEKRIKEVQNGGAVLSIREWSGKPYGSPQIEIARLTAEDGVGIQMLEYVDSGYCKSVRVDNALQSCIKIDTIAENDGLSKRDWEDWFTKHEEYMAIIHFTKFRY